MGTKRQKKKLARQHNNAQGKYVPPVPSAPDKKTVSPSIINPAPYRDSHVTWTACDIDKSSGISGCHWDLDADETIELLNFLEGVSKKTWKECLTETTSSRRNSARNHDHTISSLSPLAQKRLSERHADEEHIFRFRLAAKKRLWGFRTGAVFRILWYDREHQIYPTEKSNT